MPESKQRVLIVDDDPTIRKLLSLLVANHARFTVNQAEDGVSALQSIASEPPDILLTDLQMPGMSGLELMATVRARHPSMKLIAMSGTTDEFISQDPADAFYLKNGRNWADLIRILEAVKPPAISLDQATIS